jgi:hypothetical protein
MLQSWLCDGLIRLGSSIIIRDLQSDITGIFASAGKLLPKVCLATAGYNDAFEIDPRLANKICSLVVRKY